MTAQQDREIGLGWLGIIRCGLVQTALGSIVVLCTSTLNRVMVVELSLAATIPGALVALHYAIQLSRPRLGYGSDVARRRTNWILGGMLTLAIGAVGASVSILVMAENLYAGIALSALAFILIGAGVGASGTSLLAMVATHVKPSQKGPAATICWVMMIAGMAITGGSAGAVLDPFSAQRLIEVSAGIGVFAMVMTILATWRLEPAKTQVTQSMDAATAPKKQGFKITLAEVWAERNARDFTIFVFVSMLAYSAQDLILEPFAGLVFGMTPGESTQLSGLQHGGVLLGMIIVALSTSGMAKGRLGTLRDWTIGGCLASALSLVMIASGGFMAETWPLSLCVFCLGVSNGAFAVGAIGSMMVLASDGKGGRQGTRMGLWGAAQAVAFGLGGFLGTVAVDISNQIFDVTAVSYGTVFLAESLMFLISARLVLRIRHATDKSTQTLKQNETFARETALPNRATELQQGA